MTAAEHLAGVKLGNYRLRRLLGKGNMGVVYLAADEALLRPTAVKVLNWSPTEHDAEAWFLAEARNVAKLNHPSVVQIYNVARHDPYCYIAMEYVEGVSADVLIGRHGAFPAVRATEVMLQIIAALELAHTVELIHRDIKPGNLLIKHDGIAKLGDFGMAVSAVRGLRASVRAGTPHYFAPEIWRHEPATIASDLYAFGATYFYLLTGRPPFDAATLAELEAAHRNQPLAVPRELASGGAAACMAVIQRCMEKQPAARYPSAREVAWDLRGVLRALASSRPGAPGPDHADLTAPGPAAAGTSWRSRGFAVEPFTSLPPGEPPWRGAPFEALYRELDARIASPGATIVLAGEPGAGRSTLARTAIEAHRGDRAYIDLALASVPPGGLIQRVARAFGAVATGTTSSQPELEALLDTFARPRPGVPLIAVAGASGDPRAAVELATLARAARSTRYFVLVIVGSPALAAALAATDVELSVMTIPPLAPHEVGGYLDGWLRATRAPDAGTLIITADAALILGVRAGGNLARLNALARQMLALGGPVFTSWDAWTAADGSATADAAPRVRPREWPAPEVLELINRCRAAAGSLPRGATATRGRRP